MLRILFPLVLVGSTQSLTCCPSGWVDARVAGMGCLLFGDLTRPWLQAAQFCPFLHSGAHLLEILSEEEILQTSYKLETPIAANRTIQHLWHVMSMQCGLTK